MTPSGSGESGTGPEAAPDPRAAGRRHLRFGLRALLAFVALGFGLEFLHAFRVGWYLSEQTEPRRLMWTLAHAHGTLLALIHVALGAVWPQLQPSPRLALASRCLTTAAWTLPGGFFLGGLFIASPDPGLGIVLVPIGGLLLIAGLALISRQTEL
jgi:hypothetical protein